MQTHDSYSKSIAKKGFAFNQIFIIWEIDILIEIQFLLMNVIYPHLFRENTSNELF